MTDDLPSDDPFERSLSNRMHEAADSLDGAGVTRAAVDARVAPVGLARRRRSVALSVAAGVVVVVGMGVAAASSGPAPRPLRVSAGGADEPATTTSMAQEPVTTTSIAEVPATTHPDGGPEQQPLEDAAEGQEVWAVYLDAFDVPAPDRGTDTATTAVVSVPGTVEIHEAEDRWYAAAARASAIGYDASLSPLACDLGAPQPAGTRPRSGPDASTWTVGVYFKTQADAQAFVALAGQPTAGTGLVRVTCFDAPDPGTGHRRTR